MYSKKLLWKLRTNLPMRYALDELSEDLAIPYKYSEGYIRFLCPNCNEFQATINPRINLSHCFCCNQNFNNIDLLLSYGYSFIQGIEILMKVWEKYCSECEEEEENVRPQLAPKPDDSIPTDNFGDTL